MFKAGSKDPNKVLPANDVAYDEHETIWVDLTVGRLRRHVDGQTFMHGGGMDKFRPSVEHQIFDGKAVGFVDPRTENESAVYRPSSTQPELVIHSDGELQRMLPISDSPILASIGIFVPYWKRKEVTSILDNAQNSLLYVFPATPSPTAREVSLRARGPKEGDTEEWCIRPDLASAPTSIRVFNSGKPRLIVEVEYNGDSPPMPKRWTATHFGDRSTPDFIKVSDLVSYEPNAEVTEEMFTIPIEGKKVIVKDGKMYRVEGGKLIPTTRQELRRLEKSASMSRTPGGFIGASTEGWL
jgi:hypothetical protein